MTIKITIRGKEYFVDETDLILDNGACYQLITRQVSYIDGSPPLLSKKLFKDLKTCGFIYTDDELKEKCKKMFFGNCDLYRFDIEKMAQNDCYRVKGEQYG